MKRHTCAQGSVFGDCQELDFELEMAFFVGGPPTQPGTAITMNEVSRPPQHVCQLAARVCEHPNSPWSAGRQVEGRIFGMVIMNDWSARDIQRWEMAPLGSCPSPMMSQRCRIHRLPVQKVVPGQAAIWLPKRAAVTRSLTAASARCSTSLAAVSTSLAALPSRHAPLFLNREPKPFSSLLLTLNCAGPFGAKNFATSISTWVVPYEALLPFRAPSSAGTQHDPPPLPYLQDPRYDSFDVQLTVSIQVSNPPLTMLPLPRYFVLLRM